MSRIELSSFLLSLGMLASLAMLLGALFNLMNLPRVIGEISAGLLLGPSTLGHLNPQIFNSLFNAYEGQSIALSAFYSIGLILLMFIAGFAANELSGKANIKLVLFLVIGGITFPLIGGFHMASSFTDFSILKDSSFSIVVGISVAVTSIPVLSKIFIDLKIIHTRFAQIIIMAALIQDLVLFTMLSVALNFGVSLSTEPLIKNIILEILKLFFFIFVTFVIFKIIHKIHTISESKLEDASLGGLMLLTCILFAGAASYFGINEIFGGLLAGVLFARTASERLINAKKNIAQIATWFFIPIYFALVGLKIDLPESFNFLLTLQFLVISSALKIISVMFFARAARVGWGASFDFGLIMNCRGGPGIVIATLAYDAKIIDAEFFIALILTSIMTSLLAGMWAKYKRNSFKSFKPA